MLSFLKRKKKENPLSPGEVFHDSFADQVAWTAMNSYSFEGTGPLTLFHENSQCLRYGLNLRHVLTRFELWFIGVFFLFSGGFTLYGTWVDPAVYTHGLLGIAFSSLLLAFFLRSVWTDWSKYIFDKENGCCWKGRGFGTDCTNPNRQEKIIPLDEIHALQLLCVPGAKGEAVYELNIVNHDGGRVLLTTRRARPNSQKIAQEIADFLEVPLWDRSDIRIVKESRLRKEWNKSFQSFRRKKPDAES